MNEQVLDWESVTERYPVGTKVPGTVRKVWRFGARIELEPGLLGLLRNTEISWEEEIKDAQQVLRLSELVEVSILRHDNRREQLIVSIRWAKHDPWKAHSHEYEPGKIFRGQVARFTRDNAFVEFPDYRIIARLPVTEIVPWFIRRPDEVLDTGDWVEVMALERNDAERNIIVSMRRRLEQLEAELAGPILSAGAKMPIEPEVMSPPEEELTMSFRHILVVDDEEDERLQMEADLEDLGYEEVTSVGSIEEAESVIAKDGCDLVLLDVRFSGNGQAGLRMAEKVRQEKPSLLVVLVTGYNWIEVCRKGQALELAGMLRKPVSLTDLAKALKDIEQHGHASWPRIPIESEETQRAIANLEEIAQASTQRRPLKETHADILGRLQKATDADSSAVFSLDPQTGSIQSVALVASINISERKFLNWRGKLWKSPVKDVIYDGEHIHQNQVFRYEGKYHYLRMVRRFNSCIGVPVRLGGRSELGHGLFLFHADPGKFSEGDFMLAEATALVIGSVIREHQMIQELAEKQMLTVMGGLLTSIGHEIIGRLSVLRGADKAQSAWQRLKDNPALLQDSNFMKKTEAQLQRLVAAKDRMIRIVDSLLAPATRTTEVTVDVLSCLDMAVSAIAKEAEGKGINIVRPTASALPKACGNRTGLIQVFLNILNNAVQQMEYTHRPRGRITIETRYEPHDEHAIQIRFKDTGPGIHTRHWGKIFEPMFTTKPEGMGMGLFICEGLLSSMGGLICLEETTIMAGATFLVELREAK